MPYLLGIDTGGTYTDAVILRDEVEVISSAKSLTTRRDLAIGIGKAAQSALSEAAINPAEVSLAALSTTLATNALVEGQGEGVALIFIGFSQGDLDKHGLRDALGNDPVLELPGGHNYAGNEVCALDIHSIENWLQELDGVSAFAVASKFATRNPAHETQAMKLIGEVTGRPVSASYQLSSKLNGPKRALTAVLNARLIGMIARLINRASHILADIGVQAPLMVVRGDGALISANQALEKPIETILSGPAASIVGARWLTNIDHALVSDIGGTTTDVAVLRDGRPEIDSAGAQVGPFRTMVEAVAMRTSGLGGDSEVHFVSEGLAGGITLGPKRVLPLSLAAQEFPAEVHDALDAQLRNSVPGDHDGRFVRRIGINSPIGLPARDQALLARIPKNIVPIADVIKARIELQALSRLVSRGVVQMAALTPSDASHVLGKACFWDREAAEKGMILFGRRRAGSGEKLAQDPPTMAKIIVDQLTHQTVLALLEVAFVEDPLDFGQGPEQLARHILTQQGLNQHNGLLRLSMGLNVPVIGLGASASSYYPDVGARLSCDMILPKYAEVANAIGAVVGRVTMRESGSVTAPSEGLYRVHLDQGPQDYNSEEMALDVLEQRLREKALCKAQATGAEDIQTHVAKDIRKAMAENREIFVEATLTVEASGRPRIAHS
ncbi:MAG: hydantoinase/oxoprolinase family protein [Paracoccaceae bacterium]|nr:hydantoinase/oxoprolinase family protein [Paracoccaceae bacterium]